MKMAGVRAHTVILALLLLGMLTMNGCLGNPVRRGYDEDLEACENNPFCLRWIWNHNNTAKYGACIRKCMRDLGY